MCLGELNKSRFYDLLLLLIGERARLHHVYRGQPLRPVNVDASAYIRRRREAAEFFSQAARADVKPSKIGPMLMTAAITDGIGNLFYQYPMMNEILIDNASSAAGDPAGKPAAVGGKKS